MEATAFAGRTDVEVGDLVHVFGGDMTLAPIRRIRVIQDVWREGGALRSAVVFTFEVRGMFLRRNEFKLVQHRDGTPAPERSVVAP